MGVSTICDKIRITAMLTPYFQIGKGLPEGSRSESEPICNLILLSL